MHYRNHRICIVSFPNLLVTVRANEVGYCCTITYAITYVFLAL